MTIQRTLLPTVLQFQVVFQPVPSLVSPSPLYSSSASPVCWCSSYIHPRTRLLSRLQRFLQAQALRMWSIMRKTVQSFQRLKPMHNVCVDSIYVVFAITVINFMWCTRLPHVIVKNQTILLSWFNFLCPKLRWIYKYNKSDL